MSSALLSWIACLACAKNSRKPCISYNVAHLLRQWSCCLQEARTQLLLLVDVLRDIDVNHKGGHTAAADMAYLYAMTQIWFTVERNYKVNPL